MKSYSRCFFLVLLAQFSTIKAASLAEMLGESKIVGGSAASTGSAAYAAALTVGNADTGLIMYCGGMVVTGRSILTAGHCVQIVTERTDLVSSLRVTVGTNIWNKGGQTYAVSHNVTHPQYNDTIDKNDLGFFYTTTPIVLSDLVKPAPLDFDYVDAGITAKVVGWGRTVTGGVVSDVLNQLMVTTIDEQTCVQKAIDLHYNATYEIDFDVEICTFKSINHGTCNGDSGSPLIRTDRGTVIGCVSWGFPCALGGPDVFTRFSAFRDWITQNQV